MVAKIILTGKILKQEGNTFYLKNPNYFPEIANVFLTEGSTVKDFHQNELLDAKHVSIQDWKIEVTNI